MPEPITVTVPTIDLAHDAAVVQRNRQRIQDARHGVKAMLALLDGLDTANQALCTHPKRINQYDPGYAGGAYDGWLCDHCGKRGR